MSLVVVAVSRCGAAAAADSLRVDLAAERWTNTASTTTKVSARGAFVGGLVGVGDFDGVDFGSRLAQAMGVAATLDELPDRFLQLCGRDLVRAFHAWREIAGGAEPVSAFCSFLIAQRHGAERGSVLAAHATITGGALTFMGEVIGPPAHEMQLRSAGVLPDTAAKALFDAQFAARQEPTTVDELARAARAVVEIAIRDQDLCPTPPWWPHHRPVLGGPVVTVS